jgi:hypothetical protein
MAFASAASAFVDASAAAAMALASAASALVLASAAAFSSAMPKIPYIIKQRLNTWILIILQLVSYNVL